MSLPLSRVTLHLSMLTPMLHSPIQRHSIVSAMWFFSSRNTKKLGVYGAHASERRGAEEAAAQAVGGAPAGCRFVPAEFHPVQVFTEEGEKTKKRKAYMYVNFRKVFAARISLRGATTQSPPGSNHCRCRQRLRQTGEISKKTERTWTE